MLYREHSLSPLQRTGVARCYRKYMCAFMCCVCYSCQIGTGRRVVGRTEDVTRVTVALYKCPVNISKNTEMNVNSDDVCQEISTFVV